jgi:hypothetical protein
MQSMLLLSIALYLLQLAVEFLLSSHPSPPLCQSRYHAWTMLQLAQRSEL